MQNNRRPRRAPQQSSFLFDIAFMLFIAVAGYALWGTLNMLNENGYLPHIPILSDMLDAEPDRPQGGGTNVTVSDPLAGGGPTITSPSPKTVQATQPQASQLKNGDASDPGDTNAGGGVPAVPIEQQPPINVGGQQVQPETQPAQIVVPFAAPTPTTEYHFETAATLFGAPGGQPVVPPGSQVQACFPLTVEQTNACRFGGSTDPICGQCPSLLVNP